MRPIALATIALLCAVAACVLADDPPEGPALVNAAVGKDAPGEFRENVFAPYEPIYCGALLKGATGHVPVKAVWTALDGEHPGKVLGRAVHLRSQGVCLFKLPMRRLWQAGKYKAELFLDGKLAHSLPYTVVVPTRTPAAETAKLRTAWMALDATGTRPVRQYRRDATFYCFAQLVDAPADTQVDAVWTAVQAAGVAANTLIQRKSVATGNGEMQFSLSLPRPWPEGTYKVDIHVGGKSAETVEFTVKATPAPKLAAAAMTRDPEGNKATKVYAPGDKFYCIARYENVTPDTAVEAVWSAVQAKGFKPNAVLRRTAVIGPAPLFRFLLSLKKPWPVGRYDVDLYVEGKRAVSLPFRVEPPAQPQPAAPAPVE